MSLEETALLRAIRDTPDDDLPRLALADWLDENGVPERAEFLRVQVELSRLPPDDPRRPSREDREHELLAENEDHWLGDLASADGLHEWEFERGFLTEIAATPFCMSEHGPAVFASNPVRRWQVMSSDMDMSQDLIAAGRSSWIRRLEALDLTGWYESIGEMERFLTRSDLEHLRELDVTGRFGLDDLPDILGRSPFRTSLVSLHCGGRYGGEVGRLDAVDLVRNLATARLTELSVPGTLLTASDIRTLLAAPCFRELANLDVSLNDVDEDIFQAALCRVRALSASTLELALPMLARWLESDVLSELRSLTMNQCPAVGGNLATVTASRFWSRAEVLRLSGSVLGDGLPALFVPGAMALRTLDLLGNALNDAGVAMLGEAPWASGLTWLSLAGNRLTAEGLGQIASSGRFPQLRTLHLGGNTLDPGENEGGSFGSGEKGLLALAAASSLANLRVLGVSHYQLTSPGLDAMLNGPHWHLSGLMLSGCNLGAEAVAVLADSPRLARLTVLDLSHNPRLGGDALMPLAESPYLCRLTELDLRGVYPDDEVREALRQRLGRRLSV